MLKKVSQKTFHFSLFYSAGGALFGSMVFEAMLSCLSTAVVTALLKR